MIDVRKESLTTLATAARNLPGGGVAVSTIHRWRLRGIKGVRLETILRGGIRFTSAEALERFFVATTAAADSTAMPQRVSRERQRAIEQAERYLEEEPPSEDNTPRGRKKQEPAVDDDDDADDDDGPSMPITR